MFAAAALPACATGMGRDSHASAPMSNVFLRNSFDTDPSIYLGRFVPRDATDLDEGTAMPLTCSQHVKYRFIEGGGVKVTENFSVSSEIAARIGVPMVADAKGSASRNREVRVEYTLTGKMVADIVDPAAFEQCCEGNPDQCTDRFIGEFLQGTGTVYREDSSAVALSGSGTNPTNGVNGDGGASRTKAWTQAIEFPNPVYFAFKVTKTPNNRTTSSCGPWVDTPPVEDGFVFFVGTSRELKTERTARERALWDARFKAYGSVAAPVAPSPSGEVDPNAMQNQAAQKWAMGVQAVETCVEVVQGPRGPRFVGRVLGRLPRYVEPAPGAAPTTIPPAVPTTTMPTMETPEMPEVTLPEL
jgi:hypothetical protein